MRYSLPGRARMPGILAMTPRILLRKLVLIPVHIYRYCLSPLMPANCRFYPTCSTYAVGAVMTHGILKGGLLTLYRLARCHPWSPGGYDPVPPAKTSGYQRKC